MPNVVKCSRQEATLWSCSFIHMLRSFRSSMFRICKMPFCKNTTAFKISKIPRLTNTSSKQLLFLSLFLNKTISQAFSTQNAKYCETYSSHTRVNLLAHRGHSIVPCNGFFTWVQIIFTAKNQRQKRFSCYAVCSKVLCHFLNNTG